MNITVNGEPRVVAAGTTVHQVVLDQGEDEPRRGIAVAVDGSVVPRARLAETTLREGARVEIVTAVQGG
ncbi:MAG TPA: sulfur carrier protein ThiS [Microlunatus sp.]|nr:sulfur carrier protein ThiS [Microlunatus sp.]